MKVHHLNCGSMCPAGGKLMPQLFPQELVCHCLLIESNDRLILVDTGLGTRDVKNLDRLGVLSRPLGPVADLNLTAFEQVKSLGYSPSDVTDLIPTHLDLDHAGGISDFPHARVHISRDELSAAQSQATFRLRTRYRNCQLNEGTKWQEYDLSQGEAWNGFDCVRAIEGLPPEILLIRLPGHSPGHFGVAVDAGKNWLLHAGDSYYDHAEIINGADSPLGLRLFQRIVHSDYSAAMDTQRRLTHLKQDRSIDIFCSHDPAELRRLKQPSAD